MEFSKKNLDLVLDNLVDSLEDSRTKLFYKIIIETSCKVSELSKLKARDLRQGKIYFGKRDVPISSGLFKRISEQIKENNVSENSFLFSTRQSDSISSKRIRQIIQNTSREKLGFKIDPKDLRRHSIKLKLKTKNIEEVKQESGLKRLDKRKYLSSEQLEKLAKNIDDKRTRLIFQLLLNNLKSSQIVNFKIRDISGFKFSNELVTSLKDHADLNKSSSGDYLFNTRQNTHLSKVMIYKIISNLGKKTGIEVNPRMLNNTSIASALSRDDSENKLKELGLKTRAFHLHGGFVKNE